jgi:hypothetical protein
VELLIILQQYSVLIGEDDLSRCPKTITYYWARIKQVLEWQAEDARSFAILMVHIREAIKLGEADYSEAEEDSEDEGFANALAAAGADS